MEPVNEKRSHTLLVWSPSADLKHLVSHVSRMGTCAALANPPTHPLTKLGGRLVLIWLLDGCYQRKMNVQPEDAVLIWQPQWQHE